MKDAIIIIAATILIYFTLVYSPRAEELPPDRAVSQHKKITQMAAEYNRKNPSLLVCEIVDEKAGAVTCRNVVNVEIAIVPREIAKDWR